MLFSNSLIVYNKRSPVVVDPKQANGSGHKHESEIEKRLCNVCYEDDNELQTFVDVAVRSPITHHTWDNGQYTSYAIVVKTNSPSFTMAKSSVRRRYSEFCQLRRFLKDQHPTLLPPNLPPKTMFYRRFDSNFIEERRKGLEEFLRQVIAESLYLSNRSLHLFMQTSLSMFEIEDLVNGVESADLPDNKPPIVLSQKEDHLDSGYSRYSTGIIIEETHPSPPDHKGILKKSNSFASLCPYSTSCKYLETHSHISLGSRITICAPSLVVPDSSPEVAQSAPSQPLNIPSSSGLRHSSSDTCLKKLECESQPKKKVSFSNAVRVKQLHNL